jgi:hypothetical protein
MSWLHEQHSIVLFVLGNLRLLVLRFASCEAVFDGAGIGGSSRSCLHAKHGILPFSLGKRSLLVLRMASCHADRRGRAPRTPKRASGASAH